MQRRKEREARIRKELQEVTISPSAYDTAWVSMVPMPGSLLAPRFPQCIEWILQNQEDNGSWGIIFFWLISKQRYSLIHISMCYGTQEMELGRGVHEKRYK
jgi:hypothetical protein